MKTRCKICRKLIEFREHYCEQCKKNYIKKSKESLKNKDAEKSIKTSRWQSVRRQVLLRDKCCILCFKRGYLEQRTLQVHHIIKRVDDLTGDNIYNTDNLVTLCRKCHEEVEKLSVDEQKKILGDYKKEISLNPL